MTNAILMPNITKRIELVYKGIKQYFNQLRCSLMNSIVRKRTAKIKTFCYNNQLVTHCIRKQTSCILMHYQ